MARLTTPFNAHNVDPAQGTGGFPLGRHIVVIKKSEIKGAKTNNNSGMIAFEAEIQGGPNNGLVGSFNLNLYNENEQARKIAEQQLSAICHVTGVYMIESTEQLHMLPFMIEVTNQKLTKEQQEKADRGETVVPFTQVSRFYDVSGNPPVRGGGVAPVQGQPQQQQNNQQQQPVNNQQPQNGSQWGQQPVNNQQQQTPSGQQWGQQQQPQNNQTAAPSPAPAPQAWNQSGPANNNGAPPAWAQG